MKRSLRLLLAHKLEPWELKLVYKSYDIVGDIAVIRVPESLRRRTKTVAEAIMQTHKSVKTVLRQASPVSGDFRLRSLEFVLGDRKTETFHREHGCIFMVDLEKCYFSPRLSYERMRVAQQVKPDQVVLNMFAGVGCFSIIIAKHSEPKRIFSIDISSVAIQFMQKNIELNRVEGIVPVQGDSERIIEERFQNVADRVLMPLPEKAYEYLNSALLALKSSGGWIHYYDSEHAKKPEDPINKIKAKVTEKLQLLNVDFQVTFGRIVRSIGPNWYQVVLDIHVKRT